MATPKGCGRMDGLFVMKRINFLFYYTNGRTEMFQIFLFFYNFFSRVDNKDRQNMIKCLQN